MPLPGFFRISTRGCIDGADYRENEKGVFTIEIGHNYAVMKNKIEKLILKTHR
jgi:hypothetical protein